jgi:predicted kinase
VQAQLDEEAVMHMLQLAWLGAIRAEHLGPIRDILVQYFDGRSRHMSRILDAEPSMRALGQREVVIAAAGPEAHAGVEGQAALPTRSLPERETAARAVMETPEWRQAAETPTDPTRITTRQPGYGTPEWRAARRYFDPDTGQDISGWDAAIQHLTRIASEGAPDGVEQGRRAVILIGYPGAGKSTVAQSLRRSLRAAVVSSDDAKRIIPEYDGGANTSGVHEESAHLSNEVGLGLVRQGRNIIVETLGAQQAHVDGRAQILRGAGYQVTLIHVDVPKAVAMERAVQRFQMDGRAQPAALYDTLDAGGVYAKAKEAKTVDATGRLAWDEDGQGWRVAEASDDGLRDAIASAADARDRAGGAITGPDAGVGGRGGVRGVPEGVREDAQLGRRMAAREPSRTGKYGSLPEEAEFRKLMGRQYEIARATGDLSTQYDILGGRLINDRSMPPEMRERMELERARLAYEMGPEGRKEAGISDDVVEGYAAASGSSGAATRLHEEGTIARLARGEIYPPTADDLAAAAADVRRRQHADLVASFGGDEAKAVRFERLWKEADRATGAHADALDAEREALAREAVTNIQTVYEDADALDALARTFRDIEANPQEIPAILQRYLADIPLPGHAADERANASLAVMRKAAAIIEDNGLDSKTITAEALKTYRDRFADPEDAQFMVDALRAGLAAKPRLMRARDPSGPPPRKTLSIPGLKRPTEPLASTTREVIGTFKAQPHLDWTGLPEGEFTANLTHIAGKRGEKDAELATPAKVQAHIERVLESPTFALIDQRQGGNNSIAIVRLGRKRHQVVVIKLGRSDRGRMSIATVFNMERKTAIDRLKATLHVQGADAVTWAKTPEAQREILHLMQQVPAEHRGSSWTEATRRLKAGQAALEQGREPPGIKRSLEGPRALSRRSDGQIRLEAAQRMERAGRTETEIQQATGLFRWPPRPDGRWAGEFSDKAVQLRPEAREALAATGGARGRGRAVRQPAASLFSAPEMWRRYPELAHLTVELSRQRTVADVAAMRESGFGSGEGPQGRLTPGRPAFAEMEQGLIRIVADTPEEAAEKFVVEMNRFIGRAEGFPEGGTPNSAMEAVGRMWRSVAADEANLAERLAHLAADQEAGASKAELDLVADELAKVQAVLERLEGLYPEAAYRMLAATQAGDAMARRLRMTGMQRFVQPFLKSMEVPPEEQIVTRRGPARQFGVGEEESPGGRVLPAPNPAKGIFAALGPSGAWTGLPALPFEANLANIASKRRHKKSPTGGLADPPGKYGPRGDLHTADRVRAHIEEVLAAPDVAWVNAQRDQFSLLLVKFGDEFDRWVPVRLSAERGRVTQFIPTVFNSRRKTTENRLLAAFYNEHMRGAAAGGPEPGTGWPKTPEALEKLRGMEEGAGEWRIKWPKTSEGHQALLHLLEQVPKGNRKSSWHQFRALVYRSQSALAPSPAAVAASPAAAAPAVGETPVRRGGWRRAALNPYQEEIVADLRRQGAPTSEILESFRQMVGRDVSERTFYSYLADMEARGLVTLREIPVPAMERLTPAQIKTYVAVYNVGAAPAERLAVLRGLLADDKASRSAMYKLERALAGRGLIAPRARGEGGAGARAGGQPAGEAPAPDANPAAQSLADARRGEEIVEIVKSCKN